MHKQISAALDGFKERSDSFEFLAEGKLAH